jgi:hypothetical protein
VASQWHCHTIRHTIRRSKFIAQTLKTSRDRHFRRLVEHWRRYGQCHLHCARRWKQIRVGALRKAASLMIRQSQGVRDATSERPAAPETGFPGVRPDCRTPTAFSAATYSSQFRSSGFNVKVANNQHKARGAPK